VWPGRSAQRKPLGFETATQVDGANRIAANPAATILNSSPAKERQRIAQGFNPGSRGRNDFRSPIRGDTPLATWRKPVDVGLRFVTDDLLHVFRTV
jgi:hypothetical protein